MISPCLLRFTLMIQCRLSMLGSDVSMGISTSVPLLLRPIRCHFIRVYCCIRIHFLLLRYFQNPLYWTCSSNISFFTGCFQFGLSDTDAELFFTMVTYKDQRLAFCIFGFIKSYIVVTFGTLKLFFIKK